MLIKSYARPTNTITERYTSHRMIQQAGQTMTSYIEQLRQQATKCKFGAFENEALKDQLVLDVIDISLRKRLLHEDVLSFEKVTSLALQFESLESQSRLLNSALRTTNVYAVTDDSTNNSSSPRNPKIQSRNN